MPPPLLQTHHADWFAYSCADMGVLKLTGGTLREAAEVCTAISGTGFTEEIESLQPVREAFDLAVSRIADAVLGQADLVDSAVQPVRGKGRSTILVGERHIKCNRLEATAILAADSLRRPILNLFGATLDGENTWQTAADGEKWVRETLSPEAKQFLAAKKLSYEGALSLKPTALYNINCFIAKNPSSIYSFPTTVVSDITCTVEGPPAIVTVESTATEPLLLTTGETPVSFKIGADWPPTVRIRTSDARPLGVVVV